MSGFSGINQFGSLTTQSGEKIKFSQIDTDGDGKITQEEYNAAVKEYDLDKVDLSAVVDKDGDKTVSEEEFALWEQKEQMQEAVNNMSKTISKEFSGNQSKYLTQVATELKEYIETFADSYTDDVSGMAEAFKKALPAKYEEIKTVILANDPSTIQSAVLEEVYAELTAPKATIAVAADGTKSTTTETLSDEAKKAIQTKLETETEKFVKSYKGNNLAADLKAHLEEYMNKSDAENLSEEAATLKSAISGFGEIIDKNELAKMKEYAKEFLQAAVDKGITVKLGNSNIATTSAITSVLNKYTDGKELKAALETAIEGLSTQTLKEKVIADETTKAEAEAEKNFTSIKGSEYAVDATLINYSGIDGYYDGSKYTCKGKGNRGQIAEQAREDIESLKEQFKEQITKMLEEQGVAFDKIETVFENVFSTTTTETLDEITSSKTNHAWLNKKKTYASDLTRKEIIDNFITKFNTNIASAIDEMNASSTDMDTIDLDFTQAGKDENGNAIKDEATGKDLSTLYATGETITTRKKGADYYKETAEKMVDNMKSQMLKKAMAMCEANGVEFDNSAFDTMFDNAKSVAVNAAVTGVTSSGAKIGGIATGAAAGGTGIAAGVTTGVAVGSAGVTTGVAVGSAAAASGAIAGAIAGPIGAAAGAVVGMLVSLIGSGHHSSSSLNTRTLLDTFAEQFKTSYTAWVDKEKSETKSAS